jgi:hypothetical protein
MVHVVVLLVNILKIQIYPVPPAQYIVWIANINQS